MNWREAWSEASAWVQNLGVLGAGFGAVVRLLWSTDGNRLTSVCEGATIGGVAGGTIGFGIGLWITRQQRRECSDRTALKIRSRLLRVVRSQYERELRALMPTQDRIPLRFRSYELVAPQRGFRGLLKERDDLSAAYQKSRARSGGGRMLVLGPPGAGKTVAMLHLALLLSELAMKNSNSSIPIVMNLGAWGNDETTVSDWMVKRLTAPTGILPGQKRLATMWIETGIIAGLFDGLDEITDQERRMDCLRSLNDHLTALPGHAPGVLTCRDEQMEEISHGLVRGQRPAVNIGLRLELLDSEQVIEFLDTEMGPRSARLMALIRNDRSGPLATMLRLPFWLSLAARAPDIDALADVNSEGDVSRKLVEQFIDGSVGKRGSHERRWLAAIAGFLNDENTPDHTTFRLEHLTGNHVPTSLRVQCGIMLGMLAGTTGLIFGVWFGLSIGWLFAAVVYLRHWNVAPTRLRLPKGTALASIISSPGRLSLSLLVGLILFIQLTGLDIKLAALLIGAALTALLTWLVLTGTAVLTHSATVNEAVEVDGSQEYSHDMWLAFFMASGLACGLFAIAIRLIADWMFGSSSFMLESTPVAIQVVETFGLGFTIGGYSGLLAGLDKGGWYSILQGLARIEAHRRDLLPEPAKLFPWLSALTDTGVMRFAGGGLQFRHRMLKDYLVRESPTPGLTTIRVETTGS